LFLDFWGTAGWRCFFIFADYLEFFSFYFSTLDPRRVFLFEASKRNQKMLFHRLEVAISGIHGDALDATKPMG